MWGNIILEISFLSNYHLGFNNTRSDILIHLTQWQYWWWFWFSYLWGLYFLLFLRIFRFRTLKFRPRIATTLRPHGKWGDLIVCIIPVSWCINIITNSNLILRMIEWQAESSLFTIRVRGKQWYWVYKYDLKTVTDVMSTPKNIGTNKWRINTPGDLIVADNYLSLLQMRAHNRWCQKYWDSLVTKVLKDEGFSVSHTNLETLNGVDLRSKKPELNYFKPKVVEQERTKLLDNTTNVVEEITKTPSEVIRDSYLLELENVIKEVNSNPNMKNPAFNVNTIEDYNTYRYKNFKKIYENDDNIKINPKSYLSHFFFSDYELAKNEKYDLFGSLITEFNERIKNNLNNTNITYINHDNFQETNRWVRKSYGTKSPCRLIKYPVSNQLNSLNLKNDTDVIELLRFRYNSEFSNIHHKPFSHNNFLIMRQKRYKRIKIMPSKIKKTRNPKTGNFDKTSKIISIRHLMLVNNTFVEDINQKHVNLKYKLIKKYKKYSEQVPLTLWKRLLRVRRTLVLPAHVNITVITNSFDVVHSWFLPGLGLKLDCVPGRATHHVLHIDNVGFYYGQCAEICGRYHHHMPIRVCALPFEHFLVWWHSYGVPKLLFSVNDKKYLTKSFALRKYTW